MRPGKEKSRVNQREFELELKGDEGRTNDGEDLEAREQEIHGQ